MAITAEEKTGTFHLQTDNTSYIFQVMDNGELGQLYYGSKIHVRPQYVNLSVREQRNATTAWKLERPDFQPDVLKQEYASFGKGDFRYPAYKLIAENGSGISEFVYKRYEIVEGKTRIAGLPSAFDDTKDDAQTLIIHMEDVFSGLELELSYSIFPHQDVLVRSALFNNCGSKEFTLADAFSAQLDLPDCKYDLLHFSGSWARERHLHRAHLRPGIQSIGSMRTASSAQHNPFIMLARSGADEDTGEVFGFNLIYSGNFLDQVEVDQFETTRILLGINPAEFSWRLLPGQSFQTPECIFSYTAAGMNGLSQQLARFYREHLLPARFAETERPVLINNWEATYFDFDEKKLLSIAEKAKELGIELFVLDDGWFGCRNDDTTSLGDWFADTDKLPLGLDHLAKQIHAMQLKFGLWFEPEMISLDSRLYDRHPEWVIHVPGRAMSPGRNQFVLDFTRQEVVDYLFEAMGRIIEDAHLDYIKWDMNRHITEMFGACLAPEQQMEMPHRYILGVYQLYERLTSSYPHVLFESCASGGGRFDLGMMYYAPQAWASDNTDAAERMLIQFGTSYGYPQSMMGAHVSAVPNGQTGRVTPLETRTAVAFFGAFGYELDITALSAEETFKIKDQIKFYKKYRSLFQFGTLYRIESPFDDEQNVMSWQVVSNDKKHAVACRCQILNRANPPYTRIYFKGLTADQKYTVNDSAEKFYGDELMNAGFFVQQLMDACRHAGVSADFQAALFVLKAVE
ncbi:alpha-galactosidase [Pectinatus haikarae]|uniref:Alpha-galactosidase n=1 Tax=Pectinatus haikarae TaxID=349096 RepID=A0ABT9Y5Z1_9FIRM|nr:alpha-galactosidase [Pectinatus haikarae]MDQ0203126.1 alpha-galactosidase [Pectinatus haikarae]